MSDKNKNRKNLLTDFFRYHRNELSGEERNSLEREFQKDPFTEEAAEGYRSVSQNETLKDLKELKRHVKKRTTGRSGFIVYRIAASIAVLIAISAIFVFIEKGKQPKQLAENSISSLKPGITNNQPAAEPGIKETISNELKGKEEEKSVRSKVGKTVMEQGKRSTIISEPALAENRGNDSIPQIKVSPHEAFVADERLLAPVRAMSKERSISLFSVRGKVISSEDNLPVPGANIHIKGNNAGVITDIEGNFNINIPDSSGKTLIADYIGMESKEFQAKSDTQVEIKLDPSLTSLSEVVVVGYGVSNQKNEEEMDDVGRTPPQPSTGNLKFNKYIQSNLHRPDGTTTGQRVVVVLNFLVKTDGSIDSIRIVRSPGKQFSDEAIRVLKSGPSWKPARENGLDIEEVIRLRIVFR